MQKLVNGVFIDCTESDLNDGDTFRIPVGDGGWEQTIFFADSAEQ